MDNFAQVLLLLAVAITVVVTFQRLHIPTSLGYLLVGVMLGPHTMGPIVSMPELSVLADFGIVFLMFTIGLDFSLPQLYALRHQILGLGSGQVAFTTLLVAVVVWLAGIPAAAAFVVGAVFAQSSTTIIASLLKEQGEENRRHGRLGLAMSVFQDVTAVPFLVIIPVLGMSVGASVLAGMLGWAIAKAALTTNSLGLSLAFGGFIAGMMLGETEFRHQVASSISPFRDVLLGLFFVGIGMRFDPSAIPSIWYWTVLGALLILTSKTLLVATMVRLIGVHGRVAWRTGLMLSVGGEFGLALVAIALDFGVIDMRLGQIAITSVLLSMIAGAVLIRFNVAIADWLVGPEGEQSSGDLEIPESPQRQVVIGGYGRFGHAVATLLQSSNISFVAIDSDPNRVAKGRAEGHSVWFGDISDPVLLSSIHVERASLIVIAIDEPAPSFSAISYLQRACPQVPVIVRAPDLETSDRLRAAGAARAYPETIEASLQLGVTALQMLNVSAEVIDQVVQDVRNWDYRPVAETKPSNR